MGSHCDKPIKSLLDPTAQGSQAVLLCTVRYQLQKFQAYPGRD
jgi:hypothetical protein